MTRRTSKLGVALGTLAFLGAAACDDESTQNDSYASAITTGTGARGVDGDAGVDAARLDAARSSDDAQTYDANGHDAAEGDSGIELWTDARIAAVLSVAAEGQMALGELAQQHAQSLEVRAFADSLVSASQRLLENLTALRATEQIELRDNALSELIEETDQATLDKLEATAAADFDRAYVASQVTGLGYFVMQIDCQLAKFVANPALANLIISTRVTASQHRTDARTLSEP
jgi:predicted outer membrane protein